MKRKSKEKNDKHDDEDDDEEAQEQVKTRIWMIRILMINMSRQDP